MTTPAVPGAATVDVDHTPSSFVYADDANTVRADGWGAGVTNVRVSWNGELGRAVFRPFAAVNNLFDKQYIGSVTINSFDWVVNAPRVLEPDARNQLLYRGGSGVAREMVRLRE